MEFYESLAQLSVALLGMWWVVLEVHESAGDRPRAHLHRPLAYGYSVHLAIPGIMSLFSLAAPDNRSAWQWSFTALAAFGLLHWWRWVRPHLHRLARRRDTAWIGDSMMAVYAAVAGVAVVAILIGDANWELAAIEIEALLLSLLLAIELYLAVQILFDPAGDRTLRPPQS